MFSNSYILCITNHYFESYTENATVSDILNKVKRIRKDLLNSKELQAQNKKLLETKGDLEKNIEDNGKVIDQLKTAAEKSHIDLADAKSTIEKINLALNKSVQEVKQLRKVIKELESMNEDLRDQLADKRLNDGDIVPVDIGTVKSVRT